MTSKSTNKFSPEVSAKGNKTPRAALRAIVGASDLGVSSISAIASVPPDPILPAIARHKAAYEAALALSFAIDDVMYSDGREVSEAEWDACERARENEDAAFNELLTAAPETSVGMRATIAHLIRLDDGRLSQKMRNLLALLLNSRVLAS